MLQRSLVKVLCTAFFALTFLLIPQVSAADAWLPVSSNATSNPGILSFLPSSEVESHSIASYNTDLYVAVSAGGNVYVTKWDGSDWMSPSTNDTVTPYDVVSSHTGAKYSVNMAIDSNGLVYVVWRDAGVAPYGIQVTRLSGGVWQNPSDSTPGEQTITTTYSPYASFAIAIDSSNRPIIAWDNRYGLGDGPDVAERNNILLTRFTGSGWVDPLIGCCSVFSNVTGLSPASNEARFPSVTTNGTQMIVTYSVNDQNLYVTQNGGTSYWATFGFSMPGNHLVDNLSQFVPKQSKVIYKNGSPYVVWIRNNQLVMTQIDGFGSTVAPVAGDFLYSVLPQGTDPFISSLSVVSKDNDSFYISWMKGSPAEIYVTEYNSMNMQFRSPATGTVGQADNISNNVSESNGAGAGKTGEHIAYYNGTPVSIWQDDAGRTSPELNIFGASLQDIGTCGDGMQNIIEQCDDGNTANGDGCNSMCMLESPTNVLLGLPAQSATVIPQTVFEMSADEGHGDDLQFRVILSHKADCSVPVYTFDQSIDTNGWAAPFFAAGATAQYTVTSPLLFGPYYWCAQAIDTTALNPGTGSDQWSDVSSSRSFYVDSADNPLAPLAPGSADGTGLAETGEFAWEKLPDGRTVLLMQQGGGFAVSVLENGVRTKLSDGTPGADLLPTVSFFLSRPELFVAPDGTIYAFWDDNFLLRMSRYNENTKLWEDPVTGIAGSVEVGTYTGIPDTTNDRAFSMKSDGSIAIVIQEGSPRDTYVTVWDHTLEDFVHPLTGGIAPRYSRLTSVSNMNYDSPEIVYAGDDLYVFWHNLSLNGTILVAKANTVDQLWVDPSTGTPVTNGAQISVPTVTGLVFGTEAAVMPDGDIVITSLDYSRVIFMRFDTDTNQWGDLDQNPGAISRLEYPRTIITLPDLLVSSQGEVISYVLGFEAGEYTIFAARYDGAWQRLDKEGSETYQAISNFATSAYSPARALIYGAEDQLDIGWTQNNGSTYLYARTITLNPSSVPMPVCGNNIVEAGEVCDGTDLAGNMCSMHGFNAGVLMCASNCQSFVTTQCTATPPVIIGGTGGSGGGGYISSYTDPRAEQHSSAANSNTNTSSSPETSKNELEGMHFEDAPVTPESPWYDAFDWGTDASAIAEKLSVAGSGTVLDFSLKAGELPTRVRSCALGGELKSGEDSMFDFSDMQNHWAKEDVDVLAASGVIVGVDSARFMPDNPVTRAQMAKILLSMFCYRLPETISIVPFVDVTTDVWYTVPVTVAKAYKIVTGYLSDDMLQQVLFRPDMTVSRAEAIAMVLRAAKVPAEYIESSVATLPADVPTDRWYVQYVKYALEHGLVQKGESFHPDAPMTRAEVARLIMNYARMAK